MTDFAYFALSECLWYEFMILINELKKITFQNRKLDFQNLFRKVIFEVGTLEIQKVIIILKVKLLKFITVIKRKLLKEKVLAILWLIKLKSKRWDIDLRKKCSIKIESDPSKMKRLSKYFAFRKKYRRYLDSTILWKIPLLESL